MIEIGAHPCIYLDSSSVIRQINREAHKTNNAVNYYKLNKIISDGNIPNDILFYKKITSLFDSNIFNSIITYETNNTTINNAQNIIKLFISNAYHNPSYVLMDQEVDHATFFYAAKKILASKIVLVDPLF